MQNKYLFISLIITVFVFTSCNNEPKLVYYIQNTHQYWDTISVCIYLSGDSKDCSALTDNDSLLWKALIVKSDKNVFIRKEIKLPRVENNRSKNIVEIIKYKSDIVSSGSYGYKNKVQYNTTTIENNGGAYNIKSLITKEVPEMEGKLVNEY